MLQELLDYFSKRDIENYDIIRDVRGQSDRCARKVDEIEKVMRVTNQNSREAQENSKRMIRLEQKV